MPVAKTINVIAQARIAVNPGNGYQGAGVPEAKSLPSAAALKDKTAKLGAPKI